MEMPEIKPGMIIEIDCCDGYLYVTRSHHPEGWVEVHELWDKSETYDIRNAVIDAVFERASLAIDSNRYVNLAFERIWKRPAPKKMTHADIAEALGHDFELVEG